MEDLQKLKAAAASAQARLIYQAHLDFLTKAVFADRFDLFIQRISLPHHIQHQNTGYLSNTKADMRDKFDAFRESNRSNRVSQMIRLVTLAEFVTESEIVGEHVTEVLRGSTRALPPFANRLRLVRHDDGVWRETHAANALASKAGQIALYDLTQHGEDIPEFGFGPNQGA